MKQVIIIGALFSLLLNSNLDAQTKSERLKISNTYDINKINQLRLKLREANELRENRILNYLNKNAEAKRNFNKGGKFYSIYDIENGKPIVITTHDINGAKATKTDKLQTGGSLGLNLNGENMIIGVWDQESVLGTHDEFKDDQITPKSRVIYPEFPPNVFLGTVSDHATHVAGILLGKGKDTNAKGMAPKAILRSFDWSDDDTEALTEGGNGLLLSNHSYGVPIFNSSNTQQISSNNIGAYTSDAKIWDEVSFAAPYYLAVNSAGNDGDSSKSYPGALAPGYDKLTGNKTAKNILVVANADPFVNPISGALITLTINPSSSQGPTDDFRIKPDITGDGTNVYSSISTSNSSYDTYSGTSMASPNVAGTLLLLQQYYNQLSGNYMKSATIKGLVCHTALDDSRIGPDPIFGWGLLNAEDAANTIKDASNGLSVIKELSISNGNTYTYSFSASGSSKLKATICWTDPAGTSSSSPNNVLTPRLVNDLDIRLKDSNSTVFTPWKLDNSNVTGSAIKGDNNVDNIERIDINNPVTGQYTLTVTHKGTLVNGSQAFSLIITGSDLTLSNSELEFKKVSIWPNPTNDNINIHINSASGLYLVVLFDIHGRTVFHEKINANGSNLEYSLNTKQFSKGVYFLKVKNGNSIHNQKIIIK